MNFARISHSIQTLSFMTHLRESSLMYPVILSIHMASICLFGGLILITDLRILGFAMRDVPLAQVVRQFRVWKRMGFLVMVSAGLLLACSKIDEYYSNPYFLIKMCLIWIVFPLHALMFHGRVYGHPEALDKVPRMPGVAKAAAIGSLCIWISIICFGRLIGYYEPGNGKRADSVSLNADAPPVDAVKLTR